jgi:hypothetical protein
MRPYLRSTISVWSRALYIPVDQQQVRSNSSAIKFICSLNVICFYLMMIIVFFLSILINKHDHIIEEQKIISRKDQFEFNILEKTWKERQNKEDMCQSYIGLSVCTHDTFSFLLLNIRCTKTCCLFSNS